MSKIIKILISSVIGLIIDQVFSITDIIKQALEPFMVGPFLAPIKPVIILCFFICEIAGTYQLLQKLKVFSIMRISDD